MGKGENEVEKGVALCGMACLSCCGIVFVLGLIALGIAEIVIGAIYFHDCSIEKMIPIYLIVSGCVQILFGLLGMRDRDSKGITWGVILAIIGALFNLPWLICGTVWVYPTYATMHKDTYVPCHTVYGIITPRGARRARATTRS